MIEKFTLVFRDYYLILKKTQLKFEIVKEIQ